MIPPEANAEFVAHMEHVLDTYAQPYDPACPVVTRRKIEYWVIPPEANAEFVAHMEHVLDTYAQPYDPACPVVCMDEQPVQLVKETRPPMAATLARPTRTRRAPSTKRSSRPGLGNWFVASSSATRRSTGAG